MEGAYDVVVAGGNVAGASSAHHLASRGLRVAIVERLQGPEVGSRSCGDGIERYQFEKLGLPVPEGDFVLRDVGVAYLCSPDRRTRLRGEAAGIAIDRFGLNQHFLAEALEAGADLVDGTEAVAPIVEEGRVAGLRCRERSGGAVRDIRAPITVDATGWRGLVRRGLPEGWPATEVVPHHEMAIAYREERRRREPVDHLVVEATFDFEIAPRGLYWMADRTEWLVNVGIGMQWLPGMPGPRSTIRERVLPIYPDLATTEVLRAGGGVIPNRRPLDCPVAPGLMVVGDAACQAQPLSGSGIGASLYASRLLAEVATVALESAAYPSLEDLFPYAHAYLTTYGADQAANQVLRASLQALTNAQLNRLMGSRLISEDDLVSAARQGRLDMSFGRKVVAATRLLGEPRLVRALRRLQRDMEAAREHYSRYPKDPSQLTPWRERARRLFGGDR